VCVSQNEDQHNVFDVYLFFSRLVRSKFFFLSLYTYLFKIHTQQSIQTKKSNRKRIILVRMFFLLFFVARFLDWTKEIVRLVGILFISLLGFY
jgi:hypothetical protein